MEWTVTRAVTPEVATEASHRMAALGVSAPFLAFWLRATCELLHPEDQATVVISYDHHAGLLSFDAWVKGRRIYGADDYVSPSRV